MANPGPTLPPQRTRGRRALRTVLGRNAALVALLLVGAMIAAGCSAAAPVQPVGASPEVQETPGVEVELDGQEDDGQNQGQQADGDGQEDAADANDGQNQGQRADGDGQAAAADADAADGQDADAANGDADGQDADAADAGVDVNDKDAMREIAGKVEEDPDAADQGNAAQQNAVASEFDEVDGNAGRCPQGEQINQGQQTNASGRVCNPNPRLIPSETPSVRILSPSNGDTFAVGEDIEVVLEFSGDWEPGRFTDPNNAYGLDGVTTQNGRIHGHAHWYAKDQAGNLASFVAENDTRQEDGSGGNRLTELMPAIEQSGEIQICNDLSYGDHLIIQKGIARDFNPVDCVNVTIR